MYGPFLIAHIHNSANPLLFGDDARQWIVPFFVSDYITEYYKSALFPIGYTAFYRALALVADPTTVSKVLPYPLLLAVLVAVWAAASRLGGLAAAFSGVALCLSSGVFLDWTAGGTPRTFAFAFIGAAAVALVYGQTLWLAAIVVISAALYPTITVITGLALVLETLVLPARHRGITWQWSFKRRLGLVTIAAAGSVLLLTPMLRVKAYGQQLTQADTVAYPEFGPGGKYGEEDRPPFRSFFTELRLTTREMLNGAGRPWSYRVHLRAEPWAPQLDLAVLALIVLGFASPGLQNSPARRLLMLVVAMVAGHTAAVMFAPYLYLPQRYAIYPIPILIAIESPVAAGALPTLFHQLKRFWWVRPLVTLSMTGACLLLLGGRGSERTGLNVDWRQESQLFRFLAGLPDTALIAGWSPKEIIDSVPYITRRSAFLTYETHNAFHTGYLDEMRRRMRALVDAVFATNTAPLLQLRDHWGVTHLIVDLQHYQSATPPTYFKPFDDWIRVALERGREAGFEVPRQIKTAKVFSHGSLVVLDLRQLSVQ